jgi:hypothetical protein
VTAIDLVPEPLRLDRCQHLTNNTPYVQRSLALLVSLVRLPPISPSYAIYSRDVTVAFHIFCALTGSIARSIDHLDASSDLLTLFVLSFGSRHECVL